jgi:hypothetical protein
MPEKAFVPSSQGDADASILHHILKIVGRFKLIFGKGGVLLESKELLGDGLEAGRAKARLGCHISAALDVFSRTGSQRIMLLPS